MALNIRSVCRPHVERKPMRTSERQGCRAKVRLAPRKPGKASRYRIVEDGGDDRAGAQAHQGNGGIEAAHGIEKIPVEGHHHHVGRGIQRLNRVYIGLRGTGFVLDERGRSRPGGLDAFLQGGNGRARVGGPKPGPGIERLSLRKGQRIDLAGTVAGPVHGGVMHGHQRTIRARSDVHLHEVRNRGRLDKSHQGIFRGKQAVSAVGNNFWERSISPGRLTETEVVDGGTQRTRTPVVKHQAIAHAGLACKGDRHERHAPRSHFQRGKGIHRRMVAFPFHANGPGKRRFHLVARMPDSQGVEVNPIARVGHEGNGACRRAGPPAIDLHHIHRYPLFQLGPDGTAVIIPTGGIIPGQGNVRRCTTSIGGHESHPTARNPTAIVVRHLGIVAADVVKLYRGCRDPLDAHGSYP